MRRAAGDVDDDATAGRDQPRQRGADAVVGAGEVDRDALRPGLRIGVGDPADRRDHAGVVDQRVQRALVAIDACEQRRDLGRVGDVAADDADPRPRGKVGGSGIPHRDHDAKARLGQQFRSHAADAAGSAGDDDDTAGAVGGRLRRLGGHARLATEGQGPSV